ncbi:MAG: hypothetical protein NWS53_10155 [Salibacteraceae bacterium]|nr:hypothetical protein [Salibacteraceae bacterium]
MNIKLEPSFNNFNLRAQKLMTLILLFLFVTLGAMSQSSEFLITGKFKVDGGSNSDAKIVLEKNGQRVKTIEGTSRFDIGLDFDAVYVVSFEKKGYVSKRLRFDTHVPAARKGTGFYPFEFTIEIFEQYDDVNVVVFNQPVGQIAYSDLIDEFDYDTDYTKSIQTQIDQALKEVAEKKEEKAKEEIEKKKQEEVVNRQVTSLSTAALKNLSSGKTEEAIKNLEEALALKEDPKIAQQLQEAKAKLENDAKQNEQQTNFNNKVSEAEAALAAGDLQNAQQLFEQANGILGGDPKVSKQLENVKKQIQDKQENQQKIDQLLKDAQDALKNGNPELAAEKAKEAQNLGENEKVKDIIAKADSAIKEKQKAAEAEAAKNDQLNKIVADAEKALKDGDIAAALQKIDEAKGVMDSDPRIAALTQQANDKKAALEKEKEAASQKINQLIKEAEDALAANNLALAREKAKALDDLGETETVKRLNAAADKIEEEQENAKAEQAANEKKIATVIGDVEKAIKAGDIESASTKLDELKSLGETEKFPVLQAQLDDLVKQKAQNEESEKQKQLAFEKAIDEAKKALEVNNLDGAKLARDNAKSIFDNEQLVALSKEIEAAEEKQKAESEAKLAAQAENEKKITSLVDEIESALKKSEAELAQSKLDELKNLGGSDKVNDLQAQIDAIKAEKVKAAESVQQQKQEFESAINEAKKALAENNLDVAKSSIKKAKSIDDNQEVSEISDQIAAAEAKLKAAEKAQLEKAEKIENLLASIPQDISDANLSRAATSIVEAEKLGVPAQQLDPLRAQITNKQNEIQNQSAKAQEISDVQKAGVIALENADFENVEQAIKNLTELGANDEAANLTKRLNDAKSALANAEEAEKAQAAKIEKLVSVAQASLDDSDVKGLSAAINALEKEDPSNTRLQALKEALQSLENKQASLAAENEAEKENTKKKEEYDSEIDKAEKLLAKNDLNGAETAFGKAIELMPEESYPKEKLVEIEQLKTSQSKAEKEAAEKESQDKKQADFDKLIAKAEDEISKTDFKGAIATLKEAKQLDVDNAKAETLIQEANDAIKAAIAAQSAEQQAVELANLLKSGQEALLSKNLVAAETAFDGALILSPENKDAIDGLSAVNAEKAKIQAENDASEAENAAKKAAELEKQKAAFDDLVSQGDALANADKFNPAIEKYKAALKINDDAVVKDKITAAQAKIADLKSDEEKRAREAAESLTANRERERAQLAQIIEDESSKVSVPNTASQVSKPVVQQEKRNVTTAVAIIGDVKMGEQAIKSSPAAVMTQEDKFDAQVKIAERQQEEFSQEEKQKSLQEKYKERKTVETETVGSSIITYIYINRGNFVTVYKKVVHNWGGVFYFVDDRSTNQRFWEYSTE